MPQENSVEDRVKRVIAEQLGINDSDIKPENHLVDDLGADSLDTVELVMAVEAEFGIEIPDVEAEKLLTVQAIIDKVMSEKPEFAGCFYPKGKIKALRSRAFKILKIKISFFS